MSQSEDVRRRCEIAVELEDTMTYREALDRSERVVHI